MCIDYMLFMYSMIGSCSFLIVFYFSCIGWCEFAVFNVKLFGIGWESNGGDAGDEELVAACE